ncbi:MAG: HAMP domain-containing histidine kinase [Myxococcales bacterium]|nr:HAMP domain-containing histidine kinase [Myxococcales bacterium]
MSRSPALERRRRLSFLPLVPLAVVVLGIAAAVVVTWVGLAELEHQGEVAARRSARVLCTTLAARLSRTEPSARAAVLERAQERSGFDISLLDDGGSVVWQRGAAPPATASPDWVAEATTGGRLTVHARVATARPDRNSLLVSVAALTWILIGAAALVAYSIARDARSDVAYVDDRITEMASEGREPAGKLIPVRNVDRVGLLTVAFNGLVERFAAAERAYRQDLAGALAYDRDRSAFLAALSHELRTPLNAILGFTDVLLAEVDGPLSADAQENLEVVRAKGEHLRELIDDILELSALESGELELSRELCDLRPIAEDAVREAQINARDKPIVVELRGEAVTAWVDPRRVRQILGNVVGNAVKFTAEGTVEVVIEAQSERWAVIRVKDTGPGIAPADQATIFEEYRQVGDLAARRAGSGLGLAITRRLVQMHDGTIDLESALGQGSVFRIFLPRSEEMIP